MDETLLIKNAKQGDDNAFNSLLKPYVKQAKQTAYLLLHDYNLAQDAVQEALIQTHSSLNRFDSNKASFKTWFNRIVVNCSLKQKRKQRFTFQLHDDYENSDNTEKEYILKEDEQLLMDIVKTLKLKYQTVIVLHYFQELSISEIALTLNIREGTVKSRLHNARKKLKKNILSHNSNFSLRGDFLWKES
ncbi:RNA polymerase sigma factor [Peribacillus asahii]|uniref:RNA polymerase sigma factor n=1 Tax=Peribacillus asahii TaxID=228899 RepID=A0A398AV86_9BACI|nr:RNA polymerase sigma factor [Peribacillus asahii]RID81561.1 RNA polymerase sigma factor [Peribacillus asahii]